MAMVMMATVAMATAFALSEGELLVMAAEAGNTKTVQRLLNNGADIEQRDHKGRTALLSATHGNHVETARVLIEAGADVNAKDHIEDSPYLYAGARGHLEILRMTLTHGADLKSTNRYGGTALIPACERGHVETVRTLIDAGVDVNHINRLGWTGLLETVILGDGSAPYVQITTLLLAAGADRDITDREGLTALDHARQMGQKEIVTLLQKEDAL